MIYILALLSLLFLPNLSLQVIKPKICVNCKYFISDNYTDKYARCSLFPIEETSCYRLVNYDIDENKCEYNYCGHARKMENMCGLEGKKYKKKYIKKIIKIK